MRFLILSLIFLHSFHVFSQNDESQLIITGRSSLPNLETLPISMLGLVDVFKANSSDHSTRLDSSGYFHLEIQIDNPAYFKVLNKRLYLRPGDSVYIDIDSEANMQYSGTHSTVINQYLKEVPTRAAGGFYNYGTIVSMDASKTVDSMISLFDDKRKELYTIEKHMPEHIFKNELNRLLCLAITNSKDLMLTIEYMSKFDITQDSAETIVEKVSAKLANFRAKAEEALNIDENIVTLDEFIDHRKYFSKKDTEYPFLREFNSALELNNKIIKVKDSTDLPFFQTAIKELGKNRYKDILQKNMEFVQAKFGKSIPQFEFNDLDDNTKFLEFYKGKILFIELWATWCAPCIKLKPELLRLSELYSDDQNIAFVSISIDQDKDNWKKFVTNTPTPLVEWHASRDFIDYFQVNSIPRSIIIGRNGKLLEWNAPRPDDVRLEEKLEELLRD